MSRLRESSSSKQGRGRGAGTPNGRSALRGTAAAGREAVTELRESARHAAECVRSGFGDAMEVIGDGYQEARDTAVAAAESAKGRIERHPVVSIGVAAGVGVLIGMILRRKKRR